ncbi:MAG TPA: Sir2 family NAD-dependent protein deacetylase [Acidimicrobiales bacterium]|jgi:NAD-dependent deacetylase|nr:Sir2 family NAD-dependent protein deacetylase [Acidimicrobiales bacterium]
MPADRVAEVRGWVAGCERVVALTGAGISTDSGVPDFRGPQGVWTLNPHAERTATIQAYVADAEVRKRTWRSRLESPVWQARPNPGHLALVELERQGRLHALLTQNTDELHQLAGNDPALIVELHGTMRRVRCLSCGEEGPMAPVLDRLRAGEEDPACRTCGGILKAATVSFGQALRPADLERASRAASECDLLLAVGSTLRVSPANGLVPLARAHGARVVIVNAQPTPFDRLADAVLREPISGVLPAIVGGGVPLR